MTTPAGRYAVAQRWSEHEPGWGFRPDGWSLHADDAQLRAYLEAHARAPSGEEHDHPDGEPFSVVVDERLHQRLVATRHGLRTFDRTQVPRAGQVVADIPEGQDADGYLDRLTRRYRG